MLKKYWPLLVFVLLAVYPAVPVLDWGLDAIGQSLHLDRQLVNIFIFAILALALNLQVGQAGLLQLGIAAFFALSNRMANLTSMRPNDQFYLMGRVPKAK